MAVTFEHTDSSVIVVIGSGAGGGVVANELAQHGIDVVCLEAGKRLGFGDIVNDEREMSRKWTWTDTRIGTGDLPANSPLWTCKTVGGTTMHWTATALRGQPQEFQARATYGSVAGATLADWPVTYEELAPFYDRAEQKMGVAGTQGMPFLPPGNHFKVIEAGAKRVGYRQVDTGTMAINSVPRDGRPACLQIGWCKSGCVIGAKWSTLYTEIPNAEETGHFELRAESMAVEISHDAQGQVSGVSYFDSDGNLHHQRARAVCVAGNVVETTRLLLNSTTGMFPDGLANSSGLVGRNYMKHVFGGALGIMPGAVHFYRGVQQGGHVHDEARHDPSRGFASGYHLETASFSPAVSAGRIAPGQWGAEVTRAMEQYENFAAMLLVGEDLPRSENRITLHPTEKDAYGLPVPVVHYRDHANNVAMRSHGVKAVANIFNALDAREVFEFGSGGATHNMGVCRMSDDPAQGVCNRWGQAHDIDNLFISDGSVFPTSLSANPTLTIVALAIRQAGYIADQAAQGNI